MFCVQYVNDHSRKFLSAYEEHYIFSLSILKICMRLLRFLRHFALNCLNYLTFLTRTLNLIMSLLFPTFVLFPISACSFFALLVPFLPLKGTTLTSSLYLFIYLVSFLPITSLKKDTTLCFHYSHPCRAQLYYIFLLVFSSIFFSYLTRAIVNTQKKRQLY